MKRMPRLVIGIIITSYVLAACSPSTEVKEDRTLDIPAENIEFIEVYNGSGEVDIIGSSVSDTIEAEIDIAVMGGKEDDIRGIIEKEAVVVLQKRGNRAIARAHFAPSFFLLDLVDGYEKEIHLQLAVPKGIEIRVWDEDGDLYIQNIDNNIYVEDEIGDIIIEDATGDIEIQSGDGAVLGKRIRGMIDITDTAGDIELSDIEGGVTISDEKGAITVRSLTGNVSIVDSTGGITVERIEGNVKILGGGKGEVRINRVTGEIIQNF